MIWLEAQVLKYGMPKVLGAGALLLVLAIAAGYVGWTKLRVGYLEHKVDRRTEQRDIARAETKVARQDEKQTAGSAAITAATVARQDTHTAATRAATTRTTEVIHERIRQAPVAPAAGPADDPVVREAVDQAFARAQAAADRLQGTTRR